MAPALNRRDLSYWDDGDLADRSSDDGDLAEAKLNEKLRRLQLRRAREAEERKRREAEEAERKRREAEAEERRRREAEEEAERQRAQAARTAAKGKVSKRPSFSTWVFRISLTFVFWPLA
jgi:hypothetical protein